MLLQAGARVYGGGPPADGAESPAAGADAVRDQGSIACAKMTQLAFDVVFEPLGALLELAAGAFTAVGGLKQSKAKAKAEAETETGKKGRPELTREIHRLDHFLVK